ncbi:kinase-like domain-containing protein [Gigaspora rosea]|uniref:non-specific serine/threonine protein kinase n=1 Tax=Gigaspora rosea TaxID=44941 RepID=A0A397VJI5_9GLOM|nr:kinase-like domain-containing protein [Gigaspora rosea]
MSSPNVQNKYPEWLKKEQNEGNIVFYDYSQFKNVKDIGKDPKTENLMLVLQYANGENLRQYLRSKWHEDIFEISLKKVIKIVKQITLGLMFLHKNNIIHCDLHPKNILINNDEFLIADFGLARKVNDSLVTSLATQHGLPAYVDPQCLEQPGKKRDEKSDVYSLEETVVEEFITNDNQKPIPILTRNGAYNLFPIGPTIQTLNEPSLRNPNQTSPDDTIESITQVQIRYEVEADNRQESLQINPDDVNALRSQRIDLF